ncbi:hypothetical protein RI056_17020 [Komagataeibacter nataicola]|nr:hypothetical protein RI056_17020 [Komagataeibacter nataicola]
MNIVTIQEYCIDTQGMAQSATKERQSVGAFTQHQHLPGYKAIHACTLRKDMMT